MAAKTFDEWYSEVAKIDGEVSFRMCWNAAQNAMVERFTSTNRQSGPCSKFAECKSPIKDSCCKGLYICHK